MTQRTHHRHLSLQFHSFFLFGDGIDSSTDDLCLGSNMLMCGERLLMSLEFVRGEIPTDMYMT